MAFRGWIDEPQPEVCDLCGRSTGGARLRTAEIEGLRGFRICDLHSFRGRPSRSDIERMFPGVPLVGIGQGRVYEPGAEPWWYTDPLAIIRDTLLEDGDYLFVGDDLAPTPTTWTDRKSSLVLTVTAGAPTSATDADLNDRRVLSLSGASLEAAAFDSDPSDGLTVAAVVRSSSAGGVLVSQKDGTGTGRSWIYDATESLWATGLGGAEGLSLVSTGIYRVVSLRFAAGGDLFLRAGSVRDAVKRPSLSVESADGDLVVGSDKAGANTLAGSLAALVVAPRDVGKNILLQIDGHLSTYYGSFTVH